jgi:hypothetical protein
MAANMEALTEAVQHGFIPEGGTGLAVTLEAFPEFFRVLTAKLDELSAWMGATGFAETASAGVIDLAKTCGTATDQAEEIAMSPLIQFLRGG